MPAKRGGHISTADAQFVLQDPSHMKAAFLMLQVETGDRVDSIPRTPNATDAARGLYALTPADLERTRGIIRALLQGAA